MHMKRSASGASKPLGVLHDALAHTDQPQIT
jgi:hypothetical protein